MARELLIVDRLLEPMIARLPNGITAWRLWDLPDRDAFFREVAPRIRVLMTDAFAGASADLLGRFPALELVANFGVGYDSVDTDYCRAHGITVTNTPDVLNDDVADLAIGLLLAVSRRICEADRYVRAGRWTSGHFPLATRLSGKRLGILGLGRIGEAVARRAAAFDITVAYHNRRQRADLDYAWYPSPVELAAAVDMLIVLVPRTPATIGMVDAAVLEALGPRGILVNIARGGIVDETALLAALADGAIGGAGLDVFADEPNVPPEFFQYDNVVLTPHVGSATQETREAMAAVVLQNIVAFFRGEPLPNPVEL
ncbi:MAG: 2-hydroxyacid dehydrogenase [Gammaproteobacteria bacterium]|nr:MAG: 2-hydroxyacid dehydrogenase [Gammaproteobacteria bacterium]